KAGNAPPLTAVDPVTGVSVTFPDLNSPPYGGELFSTNLIMPEPCPFLDRSLPIVSIIRPTQTLGVAMGALTFLTNMGLFRCKPRNIGTHCAVYRINIRSENAQDQFPPHACAEDNHLRNSGQP